jgi:hypothetical protein
LGGFTCAQQRDQIYRFGDFGLVESRGENSWNVRAESKSNQRALYRGKSNHRGDSRWCLSYDMPLVKTIIMTKALCVRKSTTGID